MVTVSTSIFTNSPVNLALTDYVRFGGNLVAVSNEYSWLGGVPAEHAVKILGNDFIYSGSGDGRRLAGGTISSIVLDAKNDSESPNSGDLVITGTGGLDVTQIDHQSKQGFWGEILEGDDLFVLSGLSAVNTGPGFCAFFGDDYALRHEGESIADAGGNDEMFAGLNDFLLVGDVLLVQGSANDILFFPATYTGGDDRLFSAAGDAGSNFIGDAQTVQSFGELLGGDDVIDCSQNTHVTARAVGDADAVFGQSFVRGGDDRISMGTGGMSCAGDVMQLGGHDTVIGGNDVISGNGLSAAGDVEFLGGETALSFIDGGDDAITGGALADWISGDVLVIAAGGGGQILGGSDVLRGGAGDDLLYGEVGEGKLHGVRGGNDSLFGGEGDDALYGQTGRDRLVGNDGDDALDGGSGADHLAGGKGADEVFGGLGRDTLAGGTDGDRFVYRRAADSQAEAGRDLISDFSRRQGDKIDVTAIDAMAGDPGRDAFTQFIGNAAFSAEGQIRAFQSGGDTVIEFNTSGEAVAEFQIELANFTASALRLSDFMLEI